MLTLERMGKLCWWEIVVLNCVSWAVDMYILKTYYLVQSLHLYLVWKRRRETIEVVLVSCITLRLKEELMLILVGKGAQLVLNAWAVARADTLNSSIKERRVLKSATKGVVYLL